MKKKLTYRILFLSFLVNIFSSCASAPDGKNILKEMITHDKINTNRNNENSKTITKGRPIFVRTYIYPQIIESGDYYAGGWVFLEIGREKLALDKLLK